MTGNDCGPEIKDVKKDGRYPSVLGFNSVDTGMFSQQYNCFTKSFAWILLAVEMMLTKRKRPYKQKGPLLLENWSNVLKICLEESFKFVRVEPNVEESFSSFGSHPNSPEQDKVLSRYIEVLKKALGLQLPDKDDVSQYFS